ncbi:MAG: HD domain-containing protein, partial [Gammaproteobacteria bacterium]|nr:HD domain-containing protein [Gammaproteobacteria bacterium]
MGKAPAAADAVSSVGAILLGSGREDIVIARFDHGQLDTSRSREPTLEWASDLCRRHPRLDEAAIRAAASQLDEDSLRAHRDAALELASLVASMEMDTASVLAALFHGPVRRGAVAKSELSARIGDAAASLAASVIEMADTSILDLTSSRLLASEAKDQTANIRRMLVAVIDDGRVAVLKLAERVVALRRAKASSEERKARIATEAMTVFVPLADRLGIWQLKWELEDLSLRYLEPDAYMRIAKQLDGRRAERERRVNALVAELKQAFESHGIKAGIGGRAKHIYSIWRKMRTKNVPFDEVYDVQAVRIIVGNVAACYAALGVVHALWRPIPDELDDYIASPKENGYRSIHTAVVGASGRVFEVQIRTEEMHRDAELGVCAHWSYKGMDPEDDYYANKVAWLRQALDAHEQEGVGLAGELIDQIREQRVFVYTPKGHVLDLMAGATAVDFAYRVHTEVGQRCVGARIDGVPAPLNTTLQSGQRVRILTDPDAAPQRAWLDPELGYVRTSRAMSKIRAWFYDRHQAENVAAGRDLFLAMVD